MKIIFNILVLIFGCFIAHSQNFYWEQVDANPPLQQGLYSLYASKSGNLFVGSQLGVKKSTDGGLTWKLTSLNDWAFKFITGQNDEIIALTNNGVYGSVDEGESWELLFEGSGQGINDFLTDPEGRYYKCSAGISVSEDKGKTWKKYLGSEVINDLARNINGWIIAAVGALTSEDIDDGKAYYSTDNGQSYETFSITDKAFVSVYTSPYNGYIFLNHRRLGGIGGQYVTRDNGKSWTETGFHDIITSMIFPTADRIYATGANSGVSHSDDGGLTWRGMNAGLTDIRIIAPIVIDPDGFLYVVNVFGGFFKSSEPILTDVEEVKDNHTLELYPNPASGLVNIKLNKAAGKLSGIDFYNSTGIKVISRPEVSFSGKKITLKTDNLLNGLYLVKIKTYKKIITKHLIIKK